MKLLRTVFLPLVVGLFLLVVIAVFPSGRNVVPTPMGIVRTNSVTSSSWDKPQLVNPVTIPISDANGTPGRNLKLSQTQDYILTCTGPIQATWGLVVWGGHNIVMDGCDYVNSSTSGAAAFKNQTGTLWVHDVHFAGSQQTEGIDLQEPGTTTVVMRDLLIDPIIGSFQTNHADCLQTWSGPQRLLVDGFTCTSGYQGFFLLPNQQDSSTQETTWDFRHINLHLNGAYAFTFGTNGPQHVDFYAEHIYVDGAGEPRGYQGGEGFEDAQAGIPLGGDYVVPSGNGATGADDFPVDPMPLPGE